jgi:hypothetical protein
LPTLAGFPIKCGHIPDHDDLLGLSGGVQLQAAASIVAKCKAHVHSARATVRASSARTARAAPPTSLTHDTRETGRRRRYLSGAAEILSAMIPCVIPGAVLRILSQVAELGLRCADVLFDFALQFLRGIAHSLARHFLNLTGRFFGSTLDLILIDAHI